jgi:hypothetical protein
MKKTLQEQYLLIKEGKGHKDVFVKEAKRLFPNMVRNAATFKEASNILKSKQIIKENIVEIGSINQIPSTKKESYELAFEKFLTEERKKDYFEDEKAELKKVSKQVEEDLSHMYDNKDDKNIDNVIFGQVMMGYYAEMKDPKNKDKTAGQLRDIVLKNLAKNPIYYTEKGQFGDLDLGYTMDAPGLGEPKEPKGPHKSSGYGTLSESVNENTMTDMENLAKESNDIESFKNAWYDKYSRGEQDIDADTDEWLETIYKRANSEGHKDSLEENIDPKSQDYKDFQDILKKFNRSKDPSERGMLVRSLNVFRKKFKLKPLTFSKSLNQLTNTNESLEETQVRTVVKEIIRQELNENAQKRLKEIEEESQYEVLNTKAAKIQQEIEMREARMTRLDEDEDMKDLLDKNKIKNLKKEIKVLQKAANKVNKMLDKVNKKKSKSSESEEEKEEIVDEVELNELDPTGMETVKDLSADVLKTFKDIGAEAGKITFEEEVDDESSMKDKLKNRFNVSDEEINDFLKTHQKDIVDGADPEEEFMNYAMVNNIPHK